MAHIWGAFGPHYMMFLALKTQLMSCDSLHWNPWYNESLLLDYGWMQGGTCAIACPTLNDPCNPHFNLTWAHKSLEIESNTGFGTQFLPETHYDLSIKLIMTFRTTNWHLFNLPCGICSLDPKHVPFLFFLKNMLKFEEGELTTSLFQNQKWLKHKLACVDPKLLYFILVSNIIYLWGFWYQA